MEFGIFKYLVNTLPIILAFGVGIVHYGKSNRTFKYLFYFVVLGLVTEVSVNTMYLISDVRNNMPVGNAYFMLSFLLLGMYFMHLFKGYIHKKVFISLIIVNEVYFVINLLFFQSIFEYSALPQAVSNIICLGFATVFFHKTMVESKIKQLWNEPLIFVNLGILLYYSGSLFYSVLFNIILENAYGFTDFTTIYFWSLNAIFYTLIAFGFWKAGKQKS